MQNKFFKLLSLGFLSLFIAFLFVSSLSFTSAKVFQENGNYYAEIELKEKWNLIAGISFSEKLHSSSKLNYDAIFKSYYYDAKNNKDVEIRPDYKAGNIDPLFLYANAFWVFSAVPGKIVYRVSPSFVNKSRLGGYYSFYAGENLIAINGEMYGKTINELKGNCTITSASIWDAVKQNWTKLNLDTKLDFETKDSLVGKGINVKVASGCGFMAGGDTESNFEEMYKRYMIWNISALADYRFGGRLDNFDNYQSIDLRYINSLDNNQHSEFMMNIYNNKLDNIFLEDKVKNAGEYNFSLININGSNIYEGIMGKERTVLWISGNKFFWAWNGGDTGTFTDDALFNILVQKYLEKYGSSYLAESFRGIVSIATLKDSYTTGEAILLTDPPEEAVNELNNKNSAETSYSNPYNSNAKSDILIKTSSEMNMAPGIYEDRENNKTVFVRNDENVKEEIKNVGGYIIKLNNLPIIEKEQQLEIEAENNEKYIREHPIRSTLTLKRFFSLKTSAVASKVEGHKKTIKKEHENFKNKLNGIGSKSITGKAINEDNGEEIKINSEYEKVFNGLALAITREEAEQIKKLKEVKEVYENKEVKALLMDSVPLIGADDVWQLDKDGNNCTQTGKECLTGKNVSIAIIDTGIDYMHGDLGNCTSEQFLSGNCEKVVSGYDFINNDNNPMDDHGHGTHCAGIAAGSGEGGLKGVAPDAKLYAYKVLNSGGSGSWSTVMAGIERAVDPNNDGNISDHVDIISLSLGGGGNPDDPVSQAADNAVDSGVVAVIAAGNNGPGEGTIGSPGTARKAITVGAVYKKDYLDYNITCTPGQYTQCGLCGEDGKALCQYWGDSNPKAKQITSFSSRGPVSWSGGKLIKPDILAPGAIICSSQYDSAWNDRKCDGFIDEEHVQISGTSMATPHIAGVAALIKQKNQDWTPEEIKALIKSTADDLDYDVNIQGAGLVNAVKALERKERPTIARINTDGEISGETIDILGIAKAENFSRYELYYGSDLEDLKKGEWISICNSTFSVNNDLLCNWDFRNLPDEKYTLKLIVSSGTEQATEYSFISIVNTKIKYPQHLTEDRENWWDPGEVFPTWKNIDINGTSTGYNFDYYTLKLCNSSYSNGDDCSGVAIELENNGRNSVTKNKLGTIIGSKIEKSGFYYLTLTTFYKDRKPSIDSNLIYLETQLQEGWPRKMNLEDSSGLTFSFLDQPTIADINKDGKDDFVFAYGQAIDVIDSDGNSLPGWPVIIDIDYGYEDYKATMQTGPAVDDIDNDGYNEIVVGNNAGYMIALNHDGSYVFEPKKFGGYIATPTIADINNDGKKEIIFSDWNSWLYVADKNGDILDGWPKYLEPLKDYPYMAMTYKGPAIADINNDGKNEILILSYSCNNWGGYYPENISMRVWVFDYMGNVLSYWPKDIVTGEDFGANIIISDLDKDAEKEIILGDLNGTIYAWNSDGSYVNGWPVIIPNPSVHGAYTLSLSVSDINNDRDIEVVFTGSNNAGQCIFIYNKNGIILEGFPKCNDYINFRTGFTGIPGIENIDLDDEQEIITQSSGGTTFNGIWPFYGINIDGSIVDGYPRYLDDMPFGNVVPIGDIDNDGNNEVFFYTWAGSLFVYKTNGGNIRESWPQFQHDAQHTGCYDCDNDIISRPQSKIVNEGTDSFSGRLLIKIQKNNAGSWVDYRIAYDQDRNILSKEVVKLDGIFNPLGISVGEAGSYRVYVEFFNKSSYFDFSVVKNETQPPATCTDSDNGLNYYVRGHVDSSSAQRADDYCINSSLLMEWECISEIPGAAHGFNYNCPYGCVDGACKSYNGLKYHNDTSVNIRLNENLTYYYSLANVSNISITWTDLGSSRKADVYVGKKKIYSNQDVASPATLIKLGINEVASNLTIVGLGTGRNITVLEVNVSGTLI